MFSFQQSRWTGNLSPNRCILCFGQDAKVHQFSKPRRGVPIHRYMYDTRPNEKIFPISYARRTQCVTNFFQSVE
jgi:hypothetical protein